MADPTVYNYTRLDDLKVLSTPAPSFTVDNLNGVMTFKVKWKANGYFDCTVNGKYKLSGGSYSNMTVTGQASSGTKTLKGNQRERLETFIWSAHEDILPLEHTDISFKLTFNDGTRGIPLAESGTEWTGQTLDFRKQITKFSLDNSTSKDAFGYEDNPLAMFYTPTFHTNIKVRPILERSVDTTFASITAVDAFDYSSDDGATWTGGNTSLGNAMTTPLKIRITAPQVADNGKEYFRVRMHPVSFV